MSLRCQIFSARFCTPRRGLACPRLTRPRKQSGSPLLSSFCVLSPHDRYRMNSRVVINPIATALTSANAIELLSPYDIILDCTDNLPTRYLLSDTAVRLGKPLVSGAAQKFEGQLCTYNLPLKPAVNQPGPIARKGDHAFDVCSQPRRRRRTQGRAKSWGCSAR